MIRHLQATCITLILCLTASVASSDDDIAPLQFYDNVKGKFAEAPGIATEIRTTIEGTLARTTVTQYFLNDTAGWQEGLYQFPLPDEAAVDSLTMMIGERRVIGFVAEKAKARKIFETAKAKGQAAGLVDQHRPNLFKTSVANIPPQSLIGIEISYQSEVRLDDQRFSIRIPLAITPRYERLQRDELRRLVVNADQAWADDVVDRLTLAEFEGGNNPVSLALTLRPGFDAGLLESNSHKIEILEQELIDDQGEVYEILLADKIIPGMSDFTLGWEPAAQAEPYRAIYTEKRDDGFYNHLLIMPASPAAAENVPSTETAAPKRQVTYIIDTSGSMDGPSIRQAKQALTLALDDLDDQDLFNIIAFNDAYRKIFPRSTTANEHQVEIAKAAIDNLAAGGGTEMMPALIEALIEPEREGFLRQIVFMTDGAIGNEGQLTATIKKLVGEARFFAIGIGAAPNVHLMRHIAMAGRGSYSFIGDVNTVEKELTSLFRKMKSPVLTDLSLDLPESAGIEMFPAKLPDLLAGEPLSIAIKSQQPLTTLDVLGRRHDRDWRQTVTIGQSSSAEGIGKIFARRKIQALTFDRLGLEDQDLQQTITEIAIRHQLISRYTSLVAVDEAILRPDSEPLVRKRHDPTLPAGWQADRLTALDAAEAYRRLLHEAPLGTAEGAPQDQLKQNIHLPQTATGFQLYLALGLALMLGASVILVYRRKMQPA